MLGLSSWLLPNTRTKYILLHTHKHQKTYFINHFSYSYRSPHKYLIFFFLSLFYFLFSQYRSTSGCNGIFSRRLDFSIFNMLPKTRLNSYQIKVSVFLFFSFCHFALFLSFFDSALHTLSRSLSIPVSLSISCHHCWFILILLELFFRFLFVDVFGIALVIESIKKSVCKRVSVL